ncbi:MAG: hypothetical protein HC836_46790 [Richelia sp. RM2_1_2]|nr:hypothetical protein [Richelia sp. RM2_1_2]
MFKKLCGQAFETVNVIVGVSSLAAIAIGALTVFGNASLLGLDKIGVKTVAEKQIKQSIQIGMYCILTGGIGFFSAITVAVGIGTILSADDEEESVTSNNANSVVFKSSESISIQGNTDSLYLYQVMRINGCSHLETKLIVGRIENEALRKVVVYDFFESSYKDSLMDLFDQNFDEQLIGKAFSSSIANPRNAVRDLIDFYRPQLEFKSEEFSSFKLETCAGCRNFHGADEIVCGIHPYGWDDENCPDWESNNRQKRVYFPFEREQVIAQLNQRIEINQAVLIKNDDGTLTLWDEYTNRRFGFSWSGVLIEDSDKLIELGEHAQLLSYIQYFSVRAVIEFEYSSKIDEFAEQLKGVANIEISDTGINVRVNYSPRLNIYTERQYRFKSNGIPLYPYESIVPQQLKYNYNLVSLIEWVKANKIRRR